MVTEALFTIVKMGKQPKCPSTGGMNKDVVHIYSEILLSHKKEWNANCSNMDGPRGYHTKRSKSDRERQIHAITCMWNLKKMVPMKLFTKQKLSHRCRKQTYGYQGVWGEGINWEIGTDIYTLLDIK